MKLRNLLLKDAPLMLEWMHDDNVVGHLGTNFKAKTLEDCENFIQKSTKTEEDLHLAITDEADNYMGTVSLKHIDKQAGTAEFAITVRACAMGKGYSGFGMEQILRMGIEALKLDAIYWCVNVANARAVRFYDKHGYCRTHCVPKTLLECYSEISANLIWYRFPGC